MKTTEKSQLFPFLEAKHDGGDWRITSDFGFRMDPFGKLGTVFHDAQDIGTYTGTKLYSPVEGVITISKNHPAAGNFVAIKDTRGNTVRFLHLHSIDPTSKVGTKVAIGQILGQTGNTGNSTAAHLHIDVNTGTRSIVPLDYFKTWKA